MTVSPLVRVCAQRWRHFAKRERSKIVVAVPVGAPSTCRELGEETDELICLIQPDAFVGVGQYYDDFSQTSDEEVRELLGRPQV